MSTSPSKENIFKKIRQALTQSTPLPFPQSEGHNSVFHASQKELEVAFAEQFSRLLGKFIFCLNQDELLTQLTMLCNNMGWTKIYCPEQSLQSLLKKMGLDFNYKNLADCEAGITGCEVLVARTGTIVMSAAQESGRTTSVYAPVHICIAYTGQLVYDVKDALQKIKEKYSGNLPSLITFATGPSRTADIEKTLVVGVHGPKEVYCFLVEN